MQATKANLYTNPLTHPVTKLKGERKAYEVSRPSTNPHYFYLGQYLTKRIITQNTTRRNPLIHWPPPERPRRGSSAPELFIDEMCKVSPFTQSYFISKTLSLSPFLYLGRPIRRIGKATIIYSITL